MISGPKPVISLFMPKYNAVIYHVGKICLTVMKVIRIGKLLETFSAFERCKKRKVGELGESWAEQMAISMQGN